MTGNRSRLRNFMQKFIRTVIFGNDHFGAIMGYGDYVIDLEVAFRKHLCYVRDIDGVELIKGSRGSNLYTISVEDMMKSSPICLLSKASKNKSWLWHRRLNHLNFGIIIDLAKKDLVRGLPRLKLEKDHLCSACQLGKSKKHTHKPTTENTIMEVLHTLHIDLCGPMRVQSINGKIYILVIVDDWYVGIFHQKSIPRTPQQKVSVKTETLLLLKDCLSDADFSKALMFLWAEDVATASPYGSYTNKEIEILFQPMFDEYLEPLRVKRPVPLALTVQVPVNSAGTPSSTTIDKDAPYTSHSLSSSTLQSPSLHQGIAAGSTIIEDNPFAPQLLVIMI
ncbi:retrovirus-related pol polyprotein from transposon TNT 1-94 [Tanacetum coccineum]